MSYVTLRPSAITAAIASSRRFSTWAAAWIARDELVAALHAVAEQLRRVVVGGFGGSASGACLLFQEPDGRELHGLRDGPGMQPGAP